MSDFGETAENLSMNEVTELKRKIDYSVCFAKGICSRTNNYCNDFHKALESKGGYSACCF